MFDRTAAVLERSKGILLRCLDKPEIEEVISKSHEGACGGHKYWKETT